MTLELKPGERLEILREEKRAVSVIEMISQSGRLIISEPMVGSGRLPVKLHDKMTLYIFRDSGMLSCIVTAENIIKERGLILIEVEIRSKISRYQRRDFVRFDTLLPVTIFPLTGVENSSRLSDTEAVRLIGDKKLKGAIDKEEGFTLDISGGGMRFFMKSFLEHGSVAGCEILLDDGNNVTATLRIVRCERDQHEGHYIMGARFIGIEEGLRDRIIKYIFAEQLKRRQEARRLKEEKDS